MGAAAEKGRARASYRRGVAPIATIVSFRLGGDDGVAVEARKWAGALGDLGFDVRRVAGALTGPIRDGDFELPGLALEGDVPVPPVAEIGAAIAGSDLVVVENICSLPVNPDASRAVAAALDAHRGR